MSRLREADDRFSWLAPMVVWPIARQVLPSSPPRPQGGGAQRSDEQAVFAAIAYILATSSPWRALPRVFGVSWQNCHRRCNELTRSGFWARLHEAARLQDPDAPAVHWAQVMEQAARQRLRERDAQAGPPQAAGDAIAPAWSKPVLMPVQNDFAGRLFELRPPSPRGVLPAG